MWSDVAKKEDAILQALKHGLQTLGVSTFTILACTDEYV